MGRKRGDSVQGEEFRFICFLIGPCVLCSSTKGLPIPLVSCTSRASELPRMVVENPKKTCWRRYCRWRLDTRCDATDAIYKYKTCPPPLPSVGACRSHTHTYSLCPPSLLRSDPAFDTSSLLGAPRPRDKTRALQLLVPYCFGYPPHCRPDAVDKTNKSR